MVKAIFFTFLISLGFGSVAGAPGMTFPPLLSGYEKSDSDEEDKGEKYEELEKRLKELREELKRLGKDAEKKFLKEILPLLRREMEKLRKRLKEFHPGDDGPLAT